MSRPGAYPVCRKAGAPTTSTASYGARRSRRSGRSAGRTPTKSGWSPREALPAAERLLEHRCARAAPRARRARPTSPDGRRPRRRRAPAPRPRRGTRASGATSPGATPVAAQNRAGDGGGLALVVGLGLPVVHRARSRAPARGSSRPRGTRARSRPGRPVARAGCSTRTGYSPASPASFPARNGSYARWRRSCWPTVTTSGARFTRAVASAATALPRPAVVCRRASAGRPRSDRVPGCEADHRALVQAEDEAEVVRKADEERHLRRAGVREERRQPAPAEQVERGVAHGCPDGHRHVSPGSPPRSPPPGVYHAP